MWEIYALLPRSPKFEAQEIKRLKQALPSYAIVFEQSIDGCEELQYKNTYTMIYAYI